MWVLRVSFHFSGDEQVARPTHAGGEGGAIFSGCHEWAFAPERGRGASASWLRGRKRGSMMLYGIACLSTAVVLDLFRTMHGGAV